jgi:hypothetical protein
MFPWLKEWVAGRDNRRAGGSSVRRVRPAVEALDARLVPSAANLLGDQFLLMDTTGATAGQLIIETESRKTGAVTGVFVSMIGTLSVSAQGTGRIEGSTHFQIQFSADAHFGSPSHGFLPSLEGTEHVSLLGAGKGHGRKAFLSGSSQVFEFAQLGLRAGETDVTSQVSGHAS